jgi:two-component system, OmpR family, phosphate regulon sensor histidine kinase PhoR
MFKWRKRPQLKEFGLVEQAKLMESSSDAILAVDTLGSPIFYNSRFVVLFGDPSVKTRIWKMFTQQDVLKAYDSALKSGAPSSAESVPFEGPSGKLFFSVSASPLKRENGEVTGAIGIFHDVTALKRAEQIRIDFVANVSHELRTPLTSIKGYAETLIQDADAGRPTERRFLEAIARNTDRLVHLINDLLDLSALESTDVLQREAINTSEITARVLKNLQGMALAKKQEIRILSEAPEVKADAKRVEQVLVNLLENAVKYTPPAGEISILWENGPEESVLLKVSDTGPGIPLEHQSRLFERFYRVDRARSRELGGTGLGLAIVKHIMQRHEGTVWIESLPGQGSTFICKFPHARGV